jgi:hypothetical protein
MQPESRAEEKARLNEAIGPAWARLLEIEREERTTAVEATRRRWLENRNAHDKEEAQRVALWLPYRYWFLGLFSFS